MALTTTADVQALLAAQPFTFSDTDVDRFIATASSLVDEELTDVGLPSALLIEIEKYLAAHLASLSQINAGVSSESADDASTTYTVGQVTRTEFLQSTHFGQVAIALDTTGTLAKAGGPTPQLIAL